MKHRNFYVAAVVCACAFLGCNGSDSGQSSGGRGGAEAFGGSTGLGGSDGSGGSQASRTTSKTGATGGAASSGVGGSSRASSSRTDDGGETVGGSSSEHDSTGGVPVASGGSKTTGSKTTKTTGGASSTATTKTGENETGGKVGTGGAGGGTSANGGRSNSGGTSSTVGTKSTGGTQASGGTSAGSDGTYVPCAASPCKVLPFGDSITHGLQSSDNGGYRSQLFKLVLAGNQTLTFLGSQSAGPANVSGTAFPKNHEGYDGAPIDSGTSSYGTAGISSLIPTPAFSTIPDIVLLHIGTNDITSSKDNLATTTSTRLDALLGKIVAAAPKALIIVAQIIPVNYTSADLDNYNSKIPGLVQARVAQGQHIIVADMSKMPKTNLAADKVHPNDQGYAYMANVWYTAIKPYLR